MIIFLVTLEWKYWEVKRDSGHGGGDNCGHCNIMLGDMIRPDSSCRGNVMMGAAL